MALTRASKILIGVGIAFGVAAAAYMCAIVFIAVTYVEPPDFVPADVEVRVDPGLGPQNARRACGRLGGWVVGQVQVFERQEDGWLSPVASREDVRPHVERVEIQISLAQPTPRARALARWYDGGSTPFFGREECATDIHGVVIVDAYRMPTVGDDRIIAYDLDGLRDGKPVHFEGKIIADGAVLDSMYSHKSR
jgi:hypothetical protein